MKREIWNLSMKNDTPKKRCVTYHRKLRVRTRGNIQEVNFILYYKAYIRMLGIVQELYLNIRIFLQKKVI